MNMINPYLFEPEQVSGERASQRRARVGARDGVLLIVIPIRKTFSFYYRSIIDREGYRPHSLLIISPLCFL